MNTIKIRLDEKSKGVLEAMSYDLPIDRKFLSSEMVEQVKQCQKYCEDNLKLEIEYTDDIGQTVNLLCSPQEVEYLKRKVCFTVIGNNGSRVYSIPVDAIKSIKQTGSQASKMSLPTTIVYRIKNRLAKNYRMRDWEVLQTIEPDGNRIIVNKGEDLNELLGRLMKYGRECEVISPKFYKEEMIERINKTLSNYQ